MKNFILSLFVAGIWMFGSAQAATQVPEVDLCRAAVAHLMGRPLQIMLGTANAEFPTVVYQRPDDKKLFMFRCQIEGNKIIWATHDDRLGWGRWHDGSDSDEVTFSVDAKAVTTKLEGAGKTWPLSKF